MNLFKKAIFFTDIHFGLKSNSHTHNKDCLEFIDFVVKTGFFGAESVLMALHHDVSKFTGSSTLVDAISSTGGKVTDISCMPDGHSYLFR